MPRAPRTSAVGASVPVGVGVRLGGGVRAPSRRETGCLAFYPLLDGFDRVLPLVRAYLDAEASR